MLPPPLCESAGVRTELQAARMRIVAVAADRPPADDMCVSIDDFAAAREMTRYLLPLGHTRLGFIKGHPNQTASEERWRGFTAAVEEQGHLPHPRVEQGFFTFRSGLDAARKMLAVEPLPTAIFSPSCGVDRYSRPLSREASRAEIPQEIKFPSLRRPCRGNPG